MTTPLKPIGYYLKALDALITEDFARTLSAYELTRRDWQVLNSLALQGPLTRPELSRLLRPFWEPGARPLDEVAGALITHGLLAADADTLALTEAGRRTHAEVASLVEAGRARLMRGLTNDDYLRTVTVLDRMTANLTPGAHEQPDPGADQAGIHPPGSGRRAAPVPRPSRPGAGATNHRTAP